MLVAPNIRLCKKCGKEILKPYNIFCTLSCAISFNTRNRNRTSKVIHAFCKCCENEFVRKYKSQRFCSRSCSTKTRKHSQETKNKISNSINKYIELYPNCHEKRLKILADKRKQLPPHRCKCCDGIIENRRKTYCSPTCLSKGLSENRIKNPRKCRGRTGYYRNIWCQSTYELAFVIWALDYNLPIKRSEKRIPYIWEMKQKMYVPDFDIGTDTYEIKGWFHDNAKEKLKYAAKIGVEIIIIDSIAAQKYIEYVNNKYFVNIVKDYWKFYE